MPKRCYTCDHLASHLTKTGVPICRDCAKRILGKGLEELPEVPQELELNLDMPELELDLGKELKKEEKVLDDWDEDTLPFPFNSQNNPWSEEEED